MGDSKLFERLFNKVVAWLTAKRLFQTTAECISIYHDDPESVPIEEQRISVGFTVVEGAEGDGDIQIMDIPAGKYFIGSFEILPSEYGQAWLEVMSELNKNRLTISGVMYESYKNDPNIHPEGRHIVDICTAVI